MASAGSINRARGRRRRAQARRRRSGLVALGVLGALLMPARARADRGSIFFGNEAALRAGAVNAIVHDGSAAWYNPAGLASITSTNLDVNLNIYGLRYRRVRGGHQIRFPDTVVDGDHQHLSTYAIPSSLVFSKRFKRGFVGAVSFFVTNSSYFSFEREFHGELHAIEGGANASQWNTDQMIDIQVSSRTYALGPSIGWNVHPKVRLGLSLQALYSYGESSYQFWNNSAEQVDAGLEGRHLLAQSRLRDLDTQLGLMLTLGLQASPTDRLDLGVTIRSPQLILISWPGISLTESYVRTNVDGTSDAITTRFPERFETLRGDFDLLANLRIDAGFAYRWDKVSWSVDLNLLPRNPPTFYRRRFARTTFSARSGFLIPLGDFVTLGTGVYMDRSGAEAGPFSDPYLEHGRPSRDFSAPEAPDIFVEDIDFYGFTLGVRLERRLWRRIMAGPKGWKELAEGSEEWKRERENLYKSKVSWTTTLGIRYALGHGSVTGTVYEFGLEAADIPPERALSTTIPLSVRALDVFNHDLAFYLGTQLSF